MMTMLTRLIVDNIYKYKIVDCVPETNITCQSDLN